MVLNINPLEVTRTFIFHCNFLKYNLYKWTLCSEVFSLS